MSSFGRYLAVFVVVLGAVLVGASVAPAVLSSASEPVGDAQSPPQYQPSNLALETVEESGSIDVGGPDETKTVAIDVGHGNAITRQDLTPLVSALVAAGHEVEFVGGEGGGLAAAGSGFNATLQEADAYVVATPSRQFSTAQAKAVEAYAEAGGRVLLLEEAPTTRTTSRIVAGSGGGVEPRLDRLGSRFGVAFGTSYLYDVTHDATNFEAVFASPDGASDLTEGVERAVFRDAVPVDTGGDAEAVLRTAPETRLESTRESGAYTVLARSGNVVAVGDTTFLTPDSYREADNEVLVGNVATFLVSGDKDPCVPRTGPSRSERIPRPPTGGNMTSTPTDGSSSSQQC